MRKPKYNSVLEYFNAKHVKKPTGCWEWVGYVGTDGYGSEPASYWHKQYKAHRAHVLSYKIHNGQVKKGLCVAHLCHNKKCVNPKHLIVATYTENRMMDVSNKNYSRMYIAEGEQGVVRDAQNKVKYEDICEKHNISRERLKSILVRQYKWDPFKLRAEDVKKIKISRSKGKKLRELAEEYNCSESMICRIVKGNRR